MIIVPTRDLMYETEKVIEVLGQFHGVKAYTCTGGTSFCVNQQTLSSRVQAVIGTPGCILDLLARDALCKDHIRMLVLDEAYELLTGGFKDQVSFNSFTYQLCCGNHDEMAAIKKTHTNIEHIVHICSCYAHATI